MPKIQYIDKSIRKSGLALISQINGIVEDYQRQGYSLTLRQVYYQLVSKNVIENSEKSYANLGVLINNGRLTGLIDWTAIEDRTRYLRQLTHWDSPVEIIESAAQSYRIDLWQDQESYIEVWVEKDALIGIVEQSAIRYDVPYFSCRGFVSQSEMWEAAQRIIGKTNKRSIILHLGDHDPSGIDMSRDMQERLNKFGADVHIQRIALNMSQVEQYGSPPNPAKTTDTRYKAYTDIYGMSSLELDALEPKTLDDLICRNIEKYLDKEKFERAKIRQDQERREILIIGGLHNG